MPEAGGSSTITGVEFEMWFTALKFVDAFFDDKIKIEPQAKTYRNPQTNEIELVSVDDVLICSDSKAEFFNLKFRSPNITNWTFNALKSQKVFKQFKEQFKKTPDADLYFVSQSPALIFAELLPRITGCISIEEVNHRLPKKLSKDWELLKKELGFSDSEMLLFSKQVKFERIIDIEEIKKMIFAKLNRNVTHPEFAPNCLFQLAVKAGKTGRTIAREDIIRCFEQDDIHLKPHLKVEDLTEKLIVASESLSLFSGSLINGTPIERKEVEELFEWIKKPLEDKESPIIVVTGKAGCGKTFILKELLKRLQEKKVPALGIKTDLSSYESLKMLAEDIGLTFGIKESLAAVAEQYNKGVVILDQIDALSLSMSKERKYINIYFNLISQLKLIKGLRIVISCRSYDLQFDPGLKLLEDKLKEFKVADLTEQQVDVVLLGIDINKNTLSHTLYSLLKVPLHLKVFCDIYKPGISNLTSIKTLQDLYTELWKQKIVCLDDKSIYNDVLNALKLIVDSMDTAMRITAPSALLDGNNIGANYLKSHSIIHEQGRNQIQFFHSSFFDYCYARDFVKRQESLIRSVLEHEQGLFVRPKIKQVMAYLRETDKNRYLKELKEFLTNESLRFHVKLLVINQLAFLEDPEVAEWQIIRRLIEKDSDIAGHFIDGIRYQGWLDILVSSGYLQKIIQSSDEKTIDKAIWMLINLINTCTHSVLDFLLNCPRLNNENIAKIIFYLGKWDDDKSIQLFQQCKLFLKNAKFQYYFLLEKIVLHHPGVVMDLFFEDINKKVDMYCKSDRNLQNEELSHEEVELFEKLIKWNPQVIIPKALEVLNKIIEKTKIIGDEESRFYEDFGFHLYGRPIYYSDHMDFLSIIKRKLKNVASSNKNEFMTVIKGYLYTGSITILRLIMECYNAKPEWYIEEGFAVLINDGFLEEIVPSQLVDELKTLLKNFYPLLSDAHKEKINKLILSLSPKWERKKMKGHPSYIGYSKYQMFNAIPQDEFSKFPVLKKQFQELNRKFGKIDNSRITNFSVGIVGPPLPGNAYEKMTLEQWEASFKKYDDSTEYSHRISDPSKGGIWQHSQAFSGAVKNRPGFFYDLIVKIGGCVEISDKYLTAGIRGLFEGEYEIEKIRELLKLVRKKEGNELRKSIIWAIEYIDKKDNLDIELINILKEYALNDPDPDVENWEKQKEFHGGDPVTFAINTVRGSAVWVLGKHALKTPFPDELFAIFEKIAEDKHIAIRVCLIQFLSYMIKWNRNKAFSLFMKLTEDMCPQVIEKGIISIHHLRTKSNFHHFIPRIENILQTADDQLGQILMAAYTADIPGSKKLLEESFIINEKIKIGAIDFASRYLTATDIGTADKSGEIFRRFLNDESDKIKEKYASCFEYFKIEDFEKLYDFIFLYSKSGAIRNNATYFFVFLEKIVRNEPEKCIDLIENHSSFEKPDMRMNRLQGKLVQIVIEAYNRTMDDVYKKKAMDIFDALLQENAYKSFGLDILKEYDRE